MAETDTYTQEGYTTHTRSGEPLGEKGTENTSGNLLADIVCPALITMTNYVKILVLVHDK